MPHTTFQSVMANVNSYFDWQTFGRRLTTALETVGMVRVATAGEIDWDTTPPSTTSSVPTGFQIWRFNDALQATRPIFFKIEYSESSTYCLFITVGKGALGSAITDVLIPRTRAGNSNNTGTVTDALATTVVSTCAGGACLAVVAAYDYAGIHGRPAFIIERSRDNAGEATGDGVSLAVMSCPTNATANAPGNPFIAAAYDSGTYSAGAVPAIAPRTINGATIGAGSSLASGVIAPVLPWVAFAPGLAPWQPIAGLTYIPGDAVPGSIISTRVLKRDLAYRVIPVGTPNAGWGVAMDGQSGTSSTVTNSRMLGLMILWED